MCRSALPPPPHAVEKPVPSLLFPSGSHPGYACQCENGTQFTISSGTGEVVPFGKAPTVTTVEEGTTKPATNSERRGGGSSRLAGCPAVEGSGGGAGQTPPGRAGRPCAAAPPLPPCPVCHQPALPEAASLTVAPSLPAPAPPVPCPAETETAVFEAADYALSLRQYGDACESVNVRLLGRPLVFPDACKRKLRLGKVCGVGCKNTLKAVGFNCYRAAFATGIADPATINSTA